MRMKIIKMFKLKTTGRHCEVACMLMSNYQNSEQNHITVPNKPFENEAEYKYLGIM
jgi:hypothetical protein